MGKVGRPTKYDPSFTKEVDVYLESASKNQKHLPKVESFAIRLGVSKDSLYEWAKIYPDFSDALKKILLKQAELLIDDGIYGGKEVNSTIVKLLLQNNHGMRERVDQTTNDKDLPFTGLTDEQLNRLIESKIHQLGVAGSVAGEGEESKV
ncbi:MAG: hypothetical protein HY865_22545 [Chloroflexi bacterium]|nr:hypothetical protein [Chloroflexota bacterium]